MQFLWPNILPSTCTNLHIIVATIPFLGGSELKKCSVSISAMQVVGRGASSKKAPTLGGRKQRIIPREGVIKSYLFFAIFGNSFERNGQKFTFQVLAMPTKYHSNSLNRTE